MFAVDYEILIAALLLFIGILSSKLSPRLGLPMLVLFLLVGMLAGEAGIGGIAFDDAHAAHALGTLAGALHAALQQGVVVLDLANDCGHPLVLDEHRGSPRRYSGSPR